MKSAILSICIPTYNRASYLRRCLNSIAIQFRKEFEIEIFISNNCSNDETEEVVLDFLGILPITYKKNTTNLGPDLNIAQCYNTASGKYVMVFGDDDIFIGNALESILSVLKMGDFGIIFLNYGGFFKDPKEFKYRLNLHKNVYLFKGYDILKKIKSRIGFTSAFIVNSNAIVKEELLYSKIKNLGHIELFLKSLRQNEISLYVGKVYILQQHGNSGGYSYFEIMGKNQFIVLNDFFKESNEYIDSILNDMIIKFFPTAIMSSRKNVNEKAIYEKNQLKYLHMYYKKYTLFWIFNYPLLKLPLYFAIPYFYMVRIISIAYSQFNKIFFIEGKKM